MNIVIKSVLVITGSSLPMSTVVSHVPVGHKKAHPDVVVDYLSSGHKFYNPMRFNNDWQRSEERRKILAEIRGIRNQVASKTAAMKEYPRRFLYEQDKLISNYNASGKLLDDVINSKNV